MEDFGSGGLSGVEFFLIEVLHWKGGQASLVLPAERFCNWEWLSIPWFRVGSARVEIYQFSS